MKFVISLQKHIKKVSSVVVLIFFWFHRSILTYFVLQNWFQINDKPEGGISGCPHINTVIPFYSWQFCIMLEHSSLVICSQIQVHSDIHSRMGKGTSP
jgi:hypothetical protein